MKRIYNIIPAIYLVLSELVTVLLFGFGFFFPSASLQKSMQTEASFWGI